MSNSWLDQPRGERLTQLQRLGLHRHDAERCLLLAEAARNRPAPNNPLVGGLMHPETFVVHREHTHQEGHTACGSGTLRDDLEEVTPSRLNRLRSRLKPCRRCFSIQGGTD